MTHTNLIISKLENIISVLKDAETGQRGFLLTGRMNFLNPTTALYEKLIGLITEIKRLTTDNNLQLKSAEELRNIVTKRACLACRCLLIISEEILTQQ